MATTPYMVLTLPTPTVTPGPTYATENNTAFETIDSHDHTTGKGVPVPSAGLNINADLSFNSYNATGFRSVRLEDNASPLALVTDLGCVYRSGDDLWFNDGNGVQIQITAGGALNAASIGGIGGDYSTSTASVFYTSASKKFSFTQDTNKAAVMDFGPFIFRKETLSSNGIRMEPDAALASDYTVTWPAALPASTAAVVIGTGGAVSFDVGHLQTGVAMVFFQAAAPTGWTKAVTQNDKFLRVVSGTGGGAAGSWVLASEASHTHTGPSHTHTGPSHTHGVGSYQFEVGYTDADGTIRMYTSGGTGTVVADARQSNATAGGSLIFLQPFTGSFTGYTKDGTGSSASGGTGATGASGTGTTSAGSSHTHTHGSTQHAYIDVIVCTKN